ncbi:hypothetical protein CX676_10400 [Paracoccus zhejiangensis]|uniref:Uncharacterized protein n=2 Tax=Paracoccus zhejiangensis TaxID=1077935 RepID=A0A2H5EZ14_9RHOB|nr:hypothetical protein CX676_10400 [Paracoccus zhejiangensis]
MRRFLGKHFADYAGAILADLFGQQSSTSNPQILASLLSALNEGLRNEAPDLRPQPGRRLDEPLVRLNQDQLVQIVEYTGHPDASVRKQARRFVQSFPFDSLLGPFEDALNAAQADCSNPATGWRVYAASFYFYNRIIQSALNDQLSDNDRLAWDDRAQEIAEAMSGCNIGDSMVDAAVIDYGRATAYSWSDQIDPGDARAAGRDFIAAVGDSSANYYMQSHIAKMVSFIEQ